MLELVAKSCLSRAEISISITSNKACFIGIWFASIHAEIAELLDFFTKQFERDGVTALLKYVVKREQYEY